MTHLKQLATRERSHLIELLEHLGEMDRRRAYLADGASSLYAWCRENLLLSEWAAHARIRAARAMRKYSAIAPRLASGELNLDAIARLAPHLTVENHAAILDEARFATRAVINEIVARFQPADTGARKSVIVPQVRGDVIRAAPPELALADAGRSDAGKADELRLDEGRGNSTGAANGSVDAATLAGSAPAAAFDYRVHLTISARAHADLERLRELMRHQVPDGDPAALVEMALRFLRSRVEARVGARAPGHGKQGGVTRGVTSAGSAATVRAPGSPRDAASSRHIPMSVRRAVRERDSDQCSFRSRDGRRCGERAWLEFHHVVPHARGGRATTGNIEMRCRAHNRYEAERDFDGFVREPAIGYGGSAVVCHSSSSRARLKIAVTGLRLGVSGIYERWRGDCNPL